MSRNRRGYSLVEMVVVMGSLTVVLGLCALLLHALMRLDRAGRAELAESTSLARLSRQLRQDVRASTKADGGREALALSRPGGPAIAYRPAGGRLVREESAGGSVRRREAYFLGRLAPARFELDGSGVRLDLAGRSTEAGGLARAPISVEARLGKDRETAGLAESPE